MLFHDTGQIEQAGAAAEIKEPIKVKLLGIFPGKADLELNIAFATGRPGLSRASTNWQTCSCRPRLMSVTSTMAPAPESLPVVVAERGEGGGCGVR